MDMSIPITLLALLLAGSGYRRFMPLRGMKKECLEDVDSKTLTILDIRPYNISNEEVPGAMNLPFSYLMRSHKEIPDQPIHLIASDAIEKNMGARFLQKKGFNVVSYSLTGQNSNSDMRVPCN